jgi:enoyl-CoA hydratase
MLDAMETLTLERAGDVVHLTLNRPDKRNALNYRMCEELIAAMKAVEEDPAVKLVVFRGAGVTFCGGADVHERKGASIDWMRRRRLLAFEAYDAIQRCTRPCISVLHGTVIGSGCGIAIMTDFVVAREGATFRFPEAAIGSVGATQHLPRVIGKAMAKELLFTARFFNCAEALRMGFVNAVLPADGLEEGVAGMVAAISAAPAASLSLFKRRIEEEVHDRQVRAFQDFLAVPAIDEVVP